VKSLAAIAVIAGSVAFPAGAARDAAAPGCHLRDLTVRPVLVSPPTGLDELGLRFANRSAESCALAGAPVISLRDATGAIPLVYRHVKLRAGRVLLHPGSSAYVVISKFRCDMGSRRSADVGEVWLRGESGVRVRFIVRIGIGICRPGIRGEGHTVNVTAFQPTLRAAAAVRG
jgi:hypothetical protein